MLAEQTQHKECAFVTLTYRDETIPWVRNEETDTWHQTLDKRHLQLYLKRVRKHISRWDMHLRHFACGEYGEKTGRPHYHLIAFGLGIGGAEIFDTLWRKGFTTTYEANPKTMSYVAKYCLKGSKDGEPTSEKFTPGAETRLTTKPFRLMSNRPPIGAGLSRSIANSFYTRVGKHVSINGDVQLERALKIGRDSYPLDRTMRAHVEKNLPDTFTQPHKDALFRRDYEDPTDEETEKAAHDHNKAIKTRHSRTKL